MADIRKHEVESGAGGYEDRVLPQPTNWPLFEMASPSFKQRLMYMTGIREETDFPAVMEKMDVRPLSAKIDMPYLVMAGEDDSLSDLGCTVEHMNHVPGEKTLVVYAGEDHGMGGGAILTAEHAALHRHCRLAG